MENKTTTIQISLVTRDRLGKYRPKATRPGESYSWDWVVNFVLDRLEDYEIEEAEEKEVS